MCTTRWKHWLLWVSEVSKWVTSLFHFQHLSYQSFLWLMTDVYLSVPDSHCVGVCKDLLQQAWFDSDFMSMMRDTKFHVYSYDPEIEQQTSQQKSQQTPRLERHIRSGTQPRAYWWFSQTFAGLHTVNLSPGWSERISTSFELKILQDL